MFLNYLNLSIRLLLRNPFFTLINILGLSVGFAAFIILWPYAQSELNTDQFHKNADRIGRLSKHAEGKNSAFVLSNNTPQHQCGVARQIANEFSDIEDLTRIVLQSGFEEAKLGVDDDVLVSILNEGSIKTNFREQNVAFADANFFQFFSFPLIAGDPADVLVQPATVVLSEKVARKYFADVIPVDKIIYLKDSIPLKVTGVFKDLPKNTHMTFDMVISSSGIKAFDVTSLGDGVWDGVWGYCYIKIKEGADFTKLQHAVNKHKERLYVDCQKCPILSSFIQSLDDVVFNDLPSNAFKSKSKYFLTVLRTLSFVILALAWINYICLSINMFHKRLREIGTRKVVGAFGVDYVFQFLIEAAVINLFSFLLALTLVQLVKVPAHQLFGFYIGGWSSFSYDTIGIIGVTLGLGICVTGLYPTLMSQKKKPVELLKKLQLNREPWWIKSIITLQYTAAVSLLIWVGTVYFQLNFVLSKTIGIETNGIVIVDCSLDQNPAFRSKLEYFMEQAVHIDGIQRLAVSKSVVGDYAGYGVSVKPNRNDSDYGMHTNGGVDENFLPLYGIRLVAGRNFQADKPADQKSILLSEMAAKRLGFANPTDAIAAKVFLPWYNQDAEIIGVYEDYEFRPFLTDQRGAKGPTSFLTYKDYIIPNFYPSKISVKINLDQLSAAIPALGKLYKSVFPQEAFQWAILDEHINRHYTSEVIARNQIILFTLIAIGIACLGLLGTVSNKAAQKTKEIGIRKVLGAQLHQISRILVNTSIKQVLVAVLISLPVACFLTEQYLQKFSARITLQWWHYAVPISLLVLIMLTTIAYVVWKAARTNPVDALRYE
jgi:putative ABC transport system permease protein